jgi:hypothetical protein
MQEIFQHSHAERENCNQALKCAAQYVEDHIQAAQPERIMTDQLGGWTFDDIDWVWAIGGHISYGIGWAKLRCGLFSLRFRWVLEDTFTMRDKFPSLHQFHLKGLAQDFWVSSHLDRTFTWGKGRFQGICG